MEEFFLGALFTRKELDIINKQCIHWTIKSFEIIDRIKLQCFHHIRNKSLRMQINNFGIGFLIPKSITHGVHQVGFTQANTAINK